MPAKKTSTKQATAKKTPASLASGKANTVIYCHGIGYHRVERELRSIWDRALFGSDQGERTRMAHWVDYSRHPHPKPNC